jgi:hypothetical protein
MSVCNLVEEVETCIRMDPQSKNNKAEEGDSRRTAADAQSDPEYEPKDHDDDDSSGEDDDNDESQDHNVILQPVQRNKRKSERYASKMCGKSTSSTTNAQKNQNPTSMIRKPLQLALSRVQFATSN